VGRYCCLRLCSLISAANGLATADNELGHG
jgi:hypothetical protein